MTLNLSADEIEFLQQSNYIEREYCEEVLEDAVKAWDYAIENKDEFTLNYILGIHKILMSRLNPEIAGKFRSYKVYIAGNRKNKPKPGKLEEKLNKWINKYLGVGKRIDCNYIKKLHVDFEKIHPFGDGNGRIGRILMNVQMINSGLPLVIIHEGEEQQEYYKWFRK